MDLSKLDSYKESNRLEAKAAQGGIPKSIWESVCAFANTSGGIIVLGAKERKDKTLEVAGLDDAHKMLDDFWNAALSKDKLSARFLQEEDARIEVVDGKEVIVIEVPRVSRVMRPVFLNKDILGETWRRTHTGDHRCTREEIQSMLRDAGTTSDDSRIAEDADMDYIDYETVRKYRKRFEFRNEGHIWNDASDEDFLTFLGAAGKDKDGILRPTYAGVLMFGKDCWITRVLPNYFLDYRQETSSDTRWEDRFVSFSGDWSGNVYDFYIRVYNKLKASLKVPFKLEGIERVDDTPAHEALREAIVNCVTNANYHESRGIVCLWKDDALTIANPGEFRIPLKKAMLPGESNPRNATMLKMFAMIDAGERAGSGISKIFHGWKAAGYAEPSYEEEYGPDRTILTLPLQKAPEYNLPTNKEPDKIERLTENEKEAIRIVGRTGRVTTRALVDATGLSRKAASALLKRLSNRDYLQWHGSSNNDPEQYYSIKDDQHHSD
ncbi:MULTISPECIES: RNA-binding domain-containing protein [Gordonibacter]|uniref:DNA binding domain-containing protein n=1 Tax=Gordonibacter faecis TaxID=3047475 RepID=A0ABT7DK36_9ACTN|nr:MULTISPECIES: RNA-binding domain-containing protein [unclassified Gordonibacter]MDJ1649890.1 putative DNA binding domain-containing protein [Gordonibacter sp. KGMB12511]